MASNFAESEFSHENFYFVLTCMYVVSPFRPGFIDPNQHVRMKQRYFYHVLNSSSLTLLQSYCSHPLTYMYIRPCSYIVRQHEPTFQWNTKADVVSHTEMM